MLLDLFHTQKNLRSNSIYIKGTNIAPFLFSLWIKMNSNRRAIDSQLSWHTTEFQTAEFYSDFSSDFSNMIRKQTYKLLWKNSSGISGIVRSIFLFFGDVCGVKPSDITDFCRDAQHADKGMKESVVTTDFIPKTEKLFEDSS